MSSSDPTSSPPFHVLSCIACPHILPSPDVPLLLVLQSNVINIKCSVRRPDDFQSYLLLSSSARAPLLTFWTASYCSTCRAISPILNELLESGVGEDEGGVSFCEVEYDSPDIMSSGLGLTYMISSMPTLLSFDRGEAQTVTKVTDPAKMRDKEWLSEWIRTEARRRGSGGGGGGTGLFGGLFGSAR